LAPEVNKRQGKAVAKADCLNFYF